MLKWPCLTLSKTNPPKREKRKTHRSHTFSTTSSRGQMFHFLFSSLKWRILAKSNIQMNFFFNGYTEEFESIKFVNLIEYYVNMFFFWGFVLRHGKSLGDSSSTRAVGFSASLWGSPPPMGRLGWSARDTKRRRCFQEEENETPGRLLPPPHNRSCTRSTVKEEEQSHTHRPLPGPHPLFSFLSRTRVF